MTPETPTPPQQTPPPQPPVDPVPSAAQSITPAQAPPVAPVQPSVPPKKKLPVWVWVVIGAIGLIILGTVVFNGIRFVGEFSGVFKAVGTSIEKNSDYPERVARFEAEQKTFSAGETMQFGPTDIRVTNVGRSYQPTASEEQYISELQSRMNADDYGWVGLDTSNYEYIQVRATAQYQASRESESDLMLSGSINAFVENLARAELGGVEPLIFYINNQAQSGTRLDREVITRFKDGAANEIIYLFRKPAAASASQLTLKVQVYTRVSSIVGTEGMPTKSYTYSLAL